MNGKQGYLLRDWPGILGTLSLGLQLYVAIFAATVFVAIVTGFNVSVTLFASGVATLIALTMNRFRIPLYYGSSFSAILAIQTIVNKYGGGDTGIRIAQTGIVTAGLLQVVIGLVIKRGDRQRVMRILSPEVTGPVAMIIAYGLAGAAISMASGTCCGYSSGKTSWWIVAMVTTIAIVWWSTSFKGRGLLSMLPILGGAAIGYLVAIPFGLVSADAFKTAELVRAPHVTLPLINHSGVLSAMLTLSVVVLATVPESTAHLLQIGEVTKQIARKLGRTEEDIDNLLGVNLMSDGAGDVTTGLLGGPMGTNYGEGIASMLLSSSVTIFAVIAAAGIAILSSVSGHLEAAITTVPQAVVGGMSIYLFGAFGMVGIKMMLDIGADKILHPRTIAIVAPTLILGIAGGNAFGGALPIPLTGFMADLFPGGVPALAAAALWALLSNAILPKPDEEQPVEALPTYGRTVGD